MKATLLSMHSKLTRQETVQRLERIHNVVAKSYVVWRPDYDLFLKVSERISSDDPGLWGPIQEALWFNDPVVASGLVIKDDETVALLYENDDGFIVEPLDPC
jgi:hypothetical protein